MKSIILSVTLFLSLFTTGIFAAAKVSSVSSNNQQSVHMINLNKAEVAQLNHAYKGIGLRRAKAIVAYRSQYGPFQAVAELAEIKQIGKAYVKRNLSALEKVFTVSD